MISKEELESLREYLKRNGEANGYNSEWYSLNGLEISLGDNGVVFVYLIRDKWLIACTTYAPMSRDNPHSVIVLGFDGLMRLVEGGEMAYNNMETERILDEL